MGAGRDADIAQAEGVGYGGAENGVDLRQVVVGDGDAHGAQP